MLGPLSFNGVKVGTLMSGLYSQIPKSLCMHMEDHFCQDILQMGDAGHSKSLTIIWYSEVPPSYPHSPW